MKVIFNVLKREVRNVSKDSSLFLILLLAPILYAFIYGSIYFNKGEEKVKLALVDNDGTAISRLLTQQFDSTPMIEIIPSSNLSEANEKMYGGEVQGYFYIESGFEKNILSQKQSNVNVVLNASRFLPSSDLLSTVSKVCLTVGAGVRKTYFNKQGMGDDEAMKMTNPINMDYRPLYNSGMTYGDFLLPGLLAIILQQTLLIGVAAAFASEIEDKKLSNLYETSRGNISKIVLGKTLFYGIVFMIFGAFFTIVNFSVFDVDMRGHYFDLAFIYGLFVIAITTLAMLIGSFFKTKLLVFQVLVFSSYPIFLITGYSMPYQALPKFVQLLSDTLPTSPFLKTYISIVQSGGSLSDNLNSVVHLIVLWLIFELLLILRIKYLISNNTTSS